MHDYKKLVEALRRVGIYQDCNECEAGRWYNEFDCCLFKDAADAIEALQAEVKILKVSGREAYFEGLAAGAEPKRGKWIHVEGDEPWEWRCTACHEIAEGHGEFRFCPNCGAKMEVQDEDN